jgi:preprotein translocase SecE subunit
MSYFNFVFILFVFISFFFIFLLVSKFIFIDWFSLSIFYIAFLVFILFLYIFLTKKKRYEKYVMQLLELRYFLGSVYSEIDNIVWPKKYVAIRLSISVLAIVILVSFLVFSLDVIMVNLLRSFLFK